MKKGIFQAIALGIVITLATISAYATDNKIKSNDSEALYSSGWAVDQNSAHYHGDVHFSNTAGSSVEFAFSGTAIRVYGSRANTHGMFGVYIDDVFQQNVDTYAETSNVDTVLYERTGLESTQHTIRLTVLSDRNAAATAGFVDVDAFEYWVEASSATSNVPVWTNDSQGSYSSGWATSLNTAYYDGDVHFSNTAGSTVEYTFEGTTIRVYGSRADSHGMFGVYIDDVFLENVDTYGASAEVCTILFEKAGLENTQHTIRLNVLSERNPAATAGFVDVDAFEHWSEPAPANVPSKENDSQGIYSSGWAVDLNDIYFDGDVHFSNTAGSTVEYSFSGTAIRIYGSRANTHGMCSVYIDNAFQKNIDTYAADSEIGTILYEKTGLDNTQHTIRLVVLDQRNPVSNAGYVDIDAFEHWVEVTEENEEYIYLSDIDWDSATSGVGAVKRDANVSGTSLSLNGIIYPKGLGLHTFDSGTPADITYDLSESNYTLFTAYVGIDTGTDGNADGSAQFLVLLDGNTVYNSGVVKQNDAPLPISVDITNASTLTLRVMNGGDGYACDWADWCNAKLSNCTPTSLVCGTLQNSIMEAQIGIINNAPAIVSLKRDTQLLSERPQVIPLVSRIDVAGSIHEPQWEYYGSEYTSSLITLQFISEVHNLNLTMYFKLASEDGPMEIWSEIYNASDEEITLYRQESFKTAIDLGGNLKIWRFHKDSGYADEVGTYVDTVQNNAFLVSETNPKLNWNENGFIPCIFIDQGTSGAYLAYEFPKGRIETISISSGEKYQISLAAGLNDGFKTNLPSGETFVVPTVYFGLYEGDVDDGSNIFKRWFFNNKAPASLRQNTNEPLMELARNIYALDSNQYPLGIYSEYNKLAAQMTLFPSQQLGVELEVIDWGWWNPRKPSDWSGNSQYWPNGIAAAGALIGQNNANFALYYLLHDQYAGSEEMLTSQNSNMSEWFIGQDESSLVYGGGTGRADLGNEACVEFLKVSLLASMNENNVYSYRSDYEPILDNSYQTNRHKFGALDTAYWCATGYYELLDSLISNGKRYESCSSGGSLKDYATLKRASTVMAVDVYDPLTLRKAFYDSSFCIPSAQIHMFSKVDYCYTENEGGAIIQARYDDNAWDDYVFYSSLLGSVSWCGDTPEKYSVMPKYTSIYKEKLRPLIRNANVYHVLDRPTGEDWDAIEFYDPNTTNAIRGALFVFKPAGPDSKTIVLKGLDPDYTYTVEFQDRTQQNTTATGAQLMQEGLTIELTGEKSADIVFLK